MNLAGLSNQPIGSSSRTYIKTWRQMSSLAHITQVFAGDADSSWTKDNSYVELELKIPRPSRNRIVRMFSRIIFTKLSSSVLDNLDNFSLALIALIRLRRMMNESDYVHTYNFWFSLIACMFRSISIKLVITELGGEWRNLEQGDASLLERLRYGVLAKWVFNRVHVIAQSDGNKYYMHKAGVHEDNIITVLHSRIDPSVFRPTVNKDELMFKVLFLGRIIPQKGVHILVEAADILVNKLSCKGILFIIAGPLSESERGNPSGYFNTIIGLVRKKNLDHCFKFLFSIDIEKVVSLYSEANVYVLPSLQDALPFSVAEAMMCGTPVIGTRSGGMEEQVIDGVTGFLVPVSDPDALAQKILYLMQNKAMAISMGNASREEALQKFSVENFAKDLFNAVTSTRQENSKHILRADTRV
jgi:glycosyltransferase involved in cell wall biosynthesis